MVAAQYPVIENESMTAKWILRGLKSHPDYMNIAQAWRVTEFPPSVLEMEAVMENEEAEVDNKKAQNRQMYSMFKQFHRTPAQSNMGNRPQQHHKNPPLQEQQNLPRP